MIYGASVVYSSFLWRQGFRRDNHINYGILLAGFGFHTLAMMLRGFTLQRCPIHNLFEASMFIGWAMVIALLVLGLLPRLRFLGAFASPWLFGLGVFALMPKLDEPGARLALSEGWFSLHASLIFLAYGALGLGAVSAFMFLLQEHDLKFHKFRALFSLFPPIQRLEWLTSRLLLGGMGLLSAGLVIGFLWLKHEKGVFYQSDPKIHWSILVWLFYLAMLVLHARFAQRGRRFAWGAVGGFLFVLLTFWGFNLFSALHHPP